MRDWLKFRAHTASGLTKNEVCRRKPVNKEMQAYSIWRVFRIEGIGAKES